MNALAERAAATALRMIASYGKAVTLTRAAARSYDASATAPAAGMPSSVTLAAAITYLRTQTPGQGSVLSSRINCMVPAAGLAAPTPMDTVTIDGVTYAIDEVNPVYAGSDAVLYNIVLRR